MFKAYMTALNSFEKLKIDIIIYFRMFSFSNDLKNIKSYIRQFWFLANFDSSLAHCAASATASLL